MQTFLNEYEDMDWLWSTHLEKFRLMRLDFKSAIIHGNEDCPQKIELFKAPNPRYDAKPDKIFVLQDGDDGFFYKIA